MTCRTSRSEWKSQQFHAFHGNHFRSRHALQINEPREIFYLDMIDAGIKAINLTVIYYASGKHQESFERLEKFSK